MFCVTKLIEVVKMVNISSLLCHNKPLESTFQGMASYLATMQISAKDIGRYYKKSSSSVILFIHLCKIYIFKQIVQVH